MLTDREIQRLIELPKAVRAKTPAAGYGEESEHKRCGLKFEVGPAIAAIFAAFIRQNSKLIENFSIGRRYRANDTAVGTVTLVRYNGPHGGISRNVKEAVDCYFDDSMQRPKSIHLRFVRSEVLAA